MRFDVLTLFPALFDGFVSQSLLKKAIDRQLLAVHLHDMRQWSNDKHNKVDDRPYGGGPGMVLRVGPVVECAEAVQSLAEPKGRLIMLSPQGRKLDQTLVEELASEPRLMLLCGRYEGFDQRVSEILQPEEISLGDYILNGGEVAAMAIIEAVSRLIPGVIGDDDSPAFDSFSSGNRLLDFAQYTRPREYRGHAVPDVLLSGNHDQVARWRAEQSLLKTQIKRADLIQSSTEQPATPNANQPRKSLRSAKQPPADKPTNE
ncbi:tRNA (guanine-N(1)-)-methyltransferase [Anatilimnocola aggregata]|uniref:tRNA (guanine-N(1)-)-methyltransferase n=1 Tax=Anatilimnocola aggregata TaxID=2528021 RepID=A0A517YHT8_9BACT|nr:tRNA (guanosine(37)-N1)-methyltransferase TrmD [Anatilimnocola aggregata]QDU29781.1 tRNA (guanine-N(1)-)-methyltransferase [Anatilimnocola aggregata]